MIEQYEEYMQALAMDKSKHTIDSYRKAIVDYLSYFKIDDVSMLEKISPKEIREYMQHLHSSGMKASSVNTRIRPVKAFYNFLIDNDFIKSSPVNKVKALKTEKKLPKFLTQDEVEMMITATTTIKERAILLVLVSTGIRRAELSGLMLDDINGDVMMVRGKGNKERKLFLAPSVAEIIQKYKDWRLQKFGDSIPNLFVTKFGTAYSGEAIRSNIHSIATRAGIDPERVEQISPHVLRHTYATNMISRGVDVSVVQRGLGHSSITTTTIYAHVLDETLRSAMVSSFEKG